MTADQYVESILTKYAVQAGPYSAAAQAANAVGYSIRQWAGPWLNDLQYSGSYAKGTAISIGTDIDLFVSFSSATPATLAEMYEGLYGLAHRLGWQPRRQNVSIGISHGNVKMDLVPGKVQPGYQNYHSLYVNKRRSWTQTNVSLHIDTVIKSGRTKEIRAIKIWRTLHVLDWPSFYLELFVINALKNQRHGQLSSNVMTILTTIVGSITSTLIVDPANTNNPVSEYLTWAERTRIADQAMRSVSAPNWNQILW